MPQIISKNSPVPTELPKQSCCSHVKCILISIVLLVIGLGAGFYLGGIMSSSFTFQPGQNPEKSAVKKGSYEDGYQSALDFARKKIQEKGMFFAASQGLGIQSATVKSVSDNSIVVEFDASLLDFFAEGKLTKTVTVPDTVAVQQNIPKPMEDYQKEEDAFRQKIEDMNKKIAAGETANYENIQPPTPYTIKKLEVKDLKAGDVISVTSAADISKSDTIEATGVTLVYIPEEIKNLNQNIGNMMPGGTLSAPVPPTEMASPIPPVPPTEMIPPPTPPVPPTEITPPAPEAPNADAVKEETPPPAQNPADNAQE